jgi:hypothetical protein
MSGTTKTRDRSERVHFVPIIFLASFPRYARYARTNCDNDRQLRSSGEHARKETDVAFLRFLQGSGLACDDGNNGKAPCIRAAWTIKGHDL